MKFNSQICTTKIQSEQLLALGLKRETADMGLAGDIPIAIEDWKTQDTTLINSPAWSLDRLICMINDSDTSEDSKIEFYTKLNRYDEAIALIQSLIHIGQFNKEYLIDK